LLGPEIVWDFLFLFACAFLKRHFFVGKSYVKNLQPENFRHWIWHSNADDATAFPMSAPEYSNPESKQYSLSIKFIIESIWKVALIFSYLLHVENNY
jgi:hypothetical protein